MGVLRGSVRCAAVLLEPLQEGFEVYAVPSAPWETKKREKKKNGGSFVGGRGRGGGGNWMMADVGSQSKDRRRDKYNGL